MVETKNLIWACQEILENSIKRFQLLFEERVCFWKNVIGKGLKLKFGTFDLWKKMVNWN